MGGNVGKARVKARVKCKADPPLFSAEWVQSFVRDVCATCDLPACCRAAGISLAELARERRRNPTLDAAMLEADESIRLASIYSMRALAASGHVPSARLLASIDSPHTPVDTRRKPNPLAQYSDLQSSLDAVHQHDWCDYYSPETHQRFNRLVTMIVEDDLEDLVDAIFLESESIRTHWTDLDLPRIPETVQCRQCGTWQRMPWISLIRRLASSIQASMDEVHFKKPYVASGLVYNIMGEVVDPR